MISCLIKGGQYLFKFKTLVRVIILINRSFIKIIDVTNREIDQKQEGSEVKTFPVKLALGEIKENICLNTNNQSKTSKEQIIKQAFQFHSQGNIPEAAKLYQHFINQGFKDHRVFSNYGVILSELGKLKEAELSIRKAIELKPDFAESHYNLGDILRDLGKPQEAEVSNRKAIELNPHFTEAHLNLGIILKDLGKFEEAELSTRKAIELDLAFPEAHSNLGNILRNLGKLKEAELSLRKAIELDPDLAIAHSSLGAILKDLGKLEEAELSTRKAIELDPDLAEAHSNLGNVLRELGNLQEAELFQCKAIELDPDLAAAYSNLGVIYRELGKSNEAINSFKKAIQLNNELSLAKSELILNKGSICDWSDQEIQATWLENIGIEGSAVSPFGLLHYEDNPIKSLTRSENYYRDKYSQQAYPITCSNNIKIHIGYFSADFKTHPVMSMIAPIFELHDKSKFQIYLYSFVEKEDEFTERAKNSGCIFKNIKKLNHFETVELARKDKIDIAIDLMGYTQYNRFSIFSYRVAPIQINYLGYPGSLGSDKIDYIIADKIVIPNSHEQFYSEKIIRMPNCYLCTDDKIEISKETISRKDFNLPEEGFVFTCFNGAKKITPNEFNIWMRLLKKIKGSVLWLQASNESAMDNLRMEAEKRNVDQNRLVFAYKIELSKHLARHSLGDLGLDTFNFNGCTTSSFGLWAGMPILTKMGKSFPARMNASLLINLGLPELITYSEKEYEEVAIRIANNPNELFDLKCKIKDLRDSSLLFNSKEFTKDLENVYKELINNNIQQN